MIEVQYAYMLHGLSGVLCVFLLVLVVRLCKKSKSKKDNVIDIHTEFHEQTQRENRHSCDTISESATTVQVYRSLESEHDEIDVKQHNFSDNYERPTLSKCNPDPKHGISDSEIKKDDFRVEQNTEKLSLRTNISDSVDLEMNSLDRNANIDAM